MRILWIGLGSIFGLFSAYNFGQTGSVLALVTVFLNIATVALHYHRVGDWINRQLGEPAKFGYAAQITPYHWSK